MRKPLTSAEQAVVMENARLARTIARAFHPPPGWELDDMNQVALIALGTAAQEYEAGRGIPFGCFASRVIANALGRVQKDSRRLCRDHRRLTAMPRREAADTRMEKPDDIVLKNEFLQVRLRRLRPRWRRAVELYYIQDMTYAEVGDEMGVSEERARQIVSLSLEAMRRERVVSGAAA